MHWNQPSSIFISLEYFPLLTSFSFLVCLPSSSFGIIMRLHQSLTISLWAGDCQAGAFLQWGKSWQVLSLNLLLSRKYLPACSSADSRVCHQSASLFTAGWHTGPHTHTPVGDDSTHHLHNSQCTHTIVHTFTCTRQHTRTFKMKHIFSHGFLIIKPWIRNIIEIPCWELHLRSTTKPFNKP